MDSSVLTVSLSFLLFLFSHSLFSQQETLLLEPFSKKLKILIILFLFILFCPKLTSTTIMSTALVSPLSSQVVQESISSILMNLGFHPSSDSVGAKRVDRFQTENTVTVTTNRSSSATNSLRFLLMLVMLRDAVLRLHSNGFGILSLALFTELVHLKTVTMFTVSILAGGQDYISDLRALFFSPTNLFKPILTDLIFHQEIQDSISLTVLFQPLLTNLDFCHLSMVIPSFFYSLSLVWTDYWCSLVRILQEHLVPEIFPSNYLRKLTSRMKLETINLGRCIVVTSADNDTKIFVGGNVERMTSQSSISDRAHSKGFVAFFSPYLLMPLILRDAILRLHNNGFSIIYLALWIKFPEKTKLRSSQNVQESISPTALFQSLSDCVRSSLKLPGNEEMEMVYLSLGFVYLHLLWTIGGLLTTLAYVGIFWLLSTHAYDEKTRVSPLMAAVFVGTVIALGCFCYSVDEVLNLKNMTVFAVDDAGRQNRRSIVLSSSCTVRCNVSQGFSFDPLFS